MARKLSLPILAALPKEMLREVTERDFQLAVWRYAESRGWKCHYVYKTAQRLQDGSYRGTGTPGWPDVIAVRGEVLCAIELKAERGSATAEQKQWIAALAEVPGIQADVFKPRDAARLMEMLA